MAIPYIIVKVPQPGVPGGGTYRYQARAAGRNKLNLYDIAEDIADNSTVSYTDVVAVLSAFEKHIPKMLLRGSSVELGNLGIISVHIKSQLVDSPEKVNSNTIMTPRIHFLPGVRLKKEMINATYEKIT